MRVEEMERKISRANVIFHLLWDIDVYIYSFPMGFWIRHNVFIKSKQSFCADKHHTINDHRKNTFILRWQRLCRIYIRFWLSYYELLRISSLLIDSKHVLLFDRNEFSICYIKFSRLKGEQSWATQLKKIPNSIQFMNRIELSWIESRIMPFSAKICSFHGQKLQELHSTI